MPISTTSNRISYDGDGATKEFSFPYLFFNNSDLVVIEKNTSTGVETTKTLLTDYTVTGADNPDGGEVTMVTAPAAGVELIIKREVDITQEQEYVDNSAYLADTFNDAFDKLTMIDQQLSESIARCIQIPAGEDETLELPNKVARAGKALTFDSNGDASASQIVDYTEFYNKNELDAGALDNRYYTETELDNGKLDNRYYTESEVDTKVNNANATTIKSYDITDPQATDDGYYLQWSEAVSTWTLVSGTGGGVRDHDQLGKLDYASAGHTGFASSTALNSVSGTLNTKIDSVSGTLNSNLLNDVEEDTSPKLGGNLDTNNNNIILSPPSSTESVNGFAVSATVSGSTAFGLPLTISGSQYIVSNCSIHDQMTCIGLSTASGTGTQTVLLNGFARYDTWSWTPGDIIYVSSGTLSNSAPSNSGDLVQSIGYAITTNTILFRPDMIYGEVD